VETITTNVLYDQLISQCFWDTQPKPIIVPFNAGYKAEVICIRTALDNRISEFAPHTHTPTHINFNTDYCLPMQEHSHQYKVQLTSND